MFQPYNILFLDDERNPQDVTWVLYPNDRPINWVVVRTYDQFIAAASAYDFDIVSLDHDIQCFNSEWFAQHEQREFTGYDCIQWLAEYLLENAINSVPAVYVHSQNPIGKANMLGYWNNFITHLETLNECSVY